MKNKKGFTLVELIVVIAILVVIAGLFSVNMIRTMNKNKEEEQQNVVTKIQSAAEAYVSANPEAVERLYNGYGYVDIEVGELRDAGLLSEDLKNAETGTRVGDEELVRVKFQVGEYLEYTYPVDPTEVANTEAYELIADPLYIQYEAGSNADRWCSSESNYFMGKFNGNGTQSPSDIASIQSKLYLMKESDGKIASLDGAELKKTECNVNPSVSGTYSITYSYKDIGLNVTKTKERTVYVGTSNNDVDRFTVVINNNRGIILNTNRDSVPVTINEYYRNGSNVPNVINTTVGNMKNVGYQIDKFSTSTPGYFNALVKCIKTNSDGSTPSQQEPPYRIIDDLLDVVTIPTTCTRSVNNYVQYKGYKYRVYGKDGSTVKLIYDDSRIYAPYGQVGDCTSTSCCNSGRSTYNQLGQDAYGSGIGKTMDQYLEDFASAKGLYLEDKLQNQRTPQGDLRRVSLMTMSEYSALSNNGSCSNFLTGESFWLADSAGVAVGEGTYNKGRNAAHAYDYAVSSGGSIITAGASKSSTYEGDFYTSSVRTDRLLVRPTIYIRGAKVSRGSGTSGDPYVIN